MTATEVQELQEEWNKRFRERMDAQFNQTDKWVDGFKFKGRTEVKGTFKD